MTSALRSVMWLSAGILLIATCPVRKSNAQAMTAASGPGMSVSIGGGFTAMQADYGQRVLGGGMAYAEINISPSFGGEVEAKFLRMHTDEDVNETTYLAGLRYQFPKWRLQPYAKALVGLGEMNFPFHYASGSYLVIAPGAGFDYHFGGRWTARVIDVEYQDWPRFTYGALHPYGVSSGLSFRVTGVELFPKGTRHKH